MKRYYILPDMDYEEYKKAIRSLEDGPPKINWHENVKVEHFYGNVYKREPFFKSKEDVYILTKGFGRYSGLQKTRVTTVSESPVCIRLSYVSILRKMLIGLLILIIYFIVIAAIFSKINFFNLLSAFTTRDFFTDKDFVGFMLFATALFLFFDISYIVQSEKYVKKCFGAERITKKEFKELLQCSNQKYNNFN